MCKQCEIASVGEVLSRKNLVEVLTFWQVDTNQWFLFATNSPSERPSVSPWRKRQAEGLADCWRFGEKILQNWSETATLERSKLGRLRSGEPIFRTAAKSSYLSLSLHFLCFHLSC
jgi:hypothetical protein